MGERGPDLDAVAAPPSPCETVTAPHANLELAAERFAALADRTVAELWALARNRDLPVSPEDRVHALELLGRVDGRFPDVPYNDFVEATHEAQRWLGARR